MHEYNINNMCAIIRVVENVQSQWISTALSRSLSALLSAIAIIFMSWGDFRRGQSASGGTISMVLLSFQEAFGLLALARMHGFGYRWNL